MEICLQHCIICKHKCIPLSFVKNRRTRRVVGSIAHSLQIYIQWLSELADNRNRQSTGSSSRSDAKVAGSSAREQYVMCPSLTWAASSLNIEMMTFKVNQGRKEVSMSSSSAPRLHFHNFQELHHAKCFWRSKQALSILHPSKCKHYVCAKAKYWMSNERIR